MKLFHFKKVNVNISDFSIHIIYIYTQTLCVCLCTCVCSCFNFLYIDGTAWPAKNTDSDARLLGQDHGSAT